MNPATFILNYDPATFILNYDPAMIRNKNLGSYIFLNFIYASRLFIFVSNRNACIFLYSYIVTNLKCRPFVLQIFWQHIKINILLFVENKMKIYLDLQVIPKFNIDKVKHFFHFDFGIVKSGHGLPQCYIDVNNKNQK